MKDIEKLHKELKKRFLNCKMNEPIAPLTAYKIGGSADLYCEITKNEEIPSIIEFVQEHDIPYFFIGGGRNTVFSDKGLRGLLIHNKANSIKVQGSRVIAESGALLGQVIFEAKKHFLDGITKLTGLPGTIGGAIYGNAGAHGVEIGDFVEKVKLFDKEKGIHEAHQEYFQFSYRTSILKRTKEIVLEVTLLLPPLDPADTTVEALKFRAEKQPKGMVAGSFFKNPNASEAAGFLIDKAGLKGLRKGNIEVSQKHGNWLMNLGGGTQKDLIELASEIKKVVKNKFDIELEPENILIDEYGNTIDI